MTYSGYAVSQHEFIKIKQKLQKLEHKIEVSQNFNYTVSAPLQEKLQTAWSVQYPCLVGGTLRIPQHLLQPYLQVESGNSL